MAEAQARRSLNLIEFLRQKTVGQGCCKRAPNSEKVVALARLTLLDSVDFNALQFSDNPFTSGCRKYVSFSPQTSVADERARP